MSERPILGVCFNILIDIHCNFKCLNTVVFTIIIIAGIMCTASVYSFNIDSMQMYTVCGYQMFSVSNALL